MIMNFVDLVVDDNNDCGPFRMEFIEKSGDSIDSELFDQSSVDSEERTLTVRQQAMTSSVGEHQVWFRVWLFDYPDVPALVLSRPMTLTIDYAKSSDYMINIMPEWLMNLQN